MKKESVEKVAETKVECKKMVGEGVGFERIRRITGYLVGTVERSKEMFAPTLRFEDAPWYVRPGWAFDDTKEGDDRFIQPTPPEGWGYDLEKGVFYPLEGTEVEEPETVEELVEE